MNMVVHENETHQQQFDFHQAYPDSIYPSDKVIFILKHP